MLFINDVQIKLTTLTAVNIRFRLLRWMRPKQKSFMMGCHGAAEGGRRAFVQGKM